ncbi:uncharacterized protein EI90DRAFT_3124926 [Cantharellus anzutake]|uniref:uncharacterized protein n=1 Tax=Cantharellus anzutake TaxID=1750568 RepID=UPI001902FB43|nr:uncharacterized protein EI90DRAFT_3124926 [Cantharellus anzutake]KAF8329691.1 hypothetical protein EI90DRAFT_3124926 [Cantharellus anzutake]
MDGFALARHICSCTDELVLYSGIPSTLIGPYFPNETLSVTDFLKFKLPSLQGNLQIISACLSHCPPSTRELTESDLRSMLCPPRPVIKSLIYNYDPNDPNPPCSVKIGTHYVPINILRIWEVLFQIQSIRKMWKESEAHVEALAGCQPTHHVAVITTQKRLLSCSWNARVLGFSKSTSSSIGGLLRHLTFSCLVTTDISYHIQLLERALDANDVKARLFSPLDIQYLTGCAMQPDGNGLKRYRHDRTCKTLHQFGSELSSGSISQFGGITHINNHWIAFVISSRELTIFIADSLHWPMGNNGPPAGVKEAAATLQWWLNMSYLSSNQSVSPFRIVRLPIAYQKDFSLKLHHSVRRLGWDGSRL